MSKPMAVADVTTQYLFIGGSNDGTRMTIVEPAPRLMVRSAVRSVVSEGGGPSFAAYPDKEVYEMVPLTLRHVTIYVYVDQRVIHCDLLPMLLNGYKRG